MTNDDLHGDNQPSAEKEAEAYTSYGLALVSAVDAAIGPWLQGVVLDRFGGTIPDENQGLMEAAIEAAAVDAHWLLTELAVASADTPLSGPLERIRRAVKPVNDALAAAGVPQAHRDPVDVEMRPEDIYAIGPFTFIDLSAEVHDAGISWGAAKAYIHTRLRPS